MSLQADPRSIKANRTYTIEEAARRLGVHKNSIRAWRRKGLRTIDGERPILFLGSDIRAFLLERKSGRKRPCPPGTLYCFRCRAPRAPAIGMVDWTPFNSTTGDLLALCEVCGTEMHRHARRDALEQCMPGISVRICEVHSRLKGKPDPSLDCHLKKEVEPL